MGLSIVGGNLKFVCIKLLSIFKQFMVVLTFIGYKLNCKIIRRVQGVRIKVEITRKPLNILMPWAN